VLSPLDDYPFHQVAEPMRFAGTSDRNFYDRYYFNCHPCGDDPELFLITGMGQYPNLGVADAFAVVLHRGQHRVVRASRELGPDRSDTTVGPLRVEVLEGLHRLRVVLDDNEWGLAFDLTWTGSIPATLEPRHFDRQHGRVLFDTMRFAQTGRWTGAIAIDGERIEASPDRWWGTRDRSWGVRPVGEVEPAGIHGSRPHPGFFWIYAPMQFPDSSILVMAQERADGTRVLEEATQVFPSGDVRPPEPLGSPRHELSFVSGTRMPCAATLRLGTSSVDVEVLLPLHIGIGTGYSHEADWRHGMYQGELVVQGVHHDLTTEQGRAALWGLVDCVARFTRDDGVVGYGLFEFGCFGPYARYGFADLLDGAP
jgi:hypothetical protein